MCCAYGFCWRVNGPGPPVDIHLVISNTAPRAGGAKAEPLDDKWESEKPRLLHRTIGLLVNASVLTTESVVLYIGLSGV